MRNRKLAIFLIFIFFIYFLTLKGRAGNLSPNASGADKIEVNTPPFETSLERGRYAQTISLAENATFNIDAFANFVKPDVAWFNGHYYPAFPPGVSVLLVPAYLIGKIFNLSQVFVSLNIALVSVLVFFLIIKVGEALNLSKKASIFSAFCFSLASVAFPYSVSISAHSFSALIIVLAFYVALKLVKERNKSYVLKALILWFLFGVNLFIDYPNMIIMLPILAFAFFSDSKLYYDENDELKFKIKTNNRFLFGMISLVPILFLFIVYNFSHYGKPIAFTNTYNLQLVSRFGLKTTVLSNDIFQKIHYSSRFTLPNLIRGIQVFLISQDRGLLFFSPVFLLSFLGFFLSMKRKNKIELVMFLIFAANVVVYGSFDDPWGGWSFGPRYLIASLPFLSLAAGRAFDFLTKKSKFFKILLLILFLTSVYISLLGSLTTNAVPPGIEARALQMKDNYFYNFDYLRSSGTSSFFYTTFLSKLISPFAYSFLIFVLISIVSTLLLI